MKMIYIAFAKENMYMQWRLTKNVLNEGHIPINPFMLTDYYLADSVEEDLLRDMNNALVARCDEVWVFGKISDGVEREIGIAEKEGIPVRYRAFPG